MACRDLSGKARLLLLLNQRLRLESSENTMGGVPARFQVLRPHHICLLTLLKQDGVLNPQALATLILIVSMVCLLAYREDFILLLRSIRLFIRVMLFRFNRAEMIRKVKISLHRCHTQCRISMGPGANLLA